LKGEIKRLVPFRGFGFIRAENGEDIFFHRSALRGKDFDTLKEGTGVEFNVTRDPKGLRAVSVRITR
jgi:CspA family cold shock protein